MTNSNSETVDEIVEFIIEHEGPDLDRMAHPVKKRVQYIDLDAALREIHGAGLLHDLRAYHFKSVIDIWTEDEVRGHHLAREMIGLLIARLQQRYSSLMGIIKNINSNDFYDEQFEFRNKDGVIGYNLGSMLQSVKDYRNSSSAAVIDWIKYNPNEEIRREYTGIRPWHFGHTARGTWQGEEGKKNGRELTGQLIARLQQKYSSLIEVIKNVKKDDFYKEKFEFRNKKGLIEYNLGTMLERVHGSSPSAAVIDWIKYNPNEEIRREYTGIRPWHFGHTARGTWQGEEGKKNGRELTGQLIARLQQRYSSLIEVIKNINADDFTKEEFEFKNKEGVIKYNCYGALRANNYSPSAAVIDWIKHEPQHIKRRYSFVKPIHFVGSPECRGRRLEGRLNLYDLSKIRKRRTYDTSVLGFTQFHSSDKCATREMMAEQAAEVLGDANVAYLGLESERFESLSTLYERLNLDSASSTIIEREERVYNAMVAMQAGATNGLRKALDGTDIIHGSLVDEVAKMQDKRYNYVNYDFVGHLSKSNERALGALFENNLLADTAVVYVTLQDTEISKTRAEMAGFEDQVRALNGIMQNYSTTHTSEQMFTLDYEGGTTERKVTPMVVVGYQVHKIAA
jgi:hypothetical protein